MLIDLAKLPRACVYAVVDEERRKVYINYSMNVVGAIPRLWDQIREPGCTLEFVVLSVTTDIETLKLHTEYWRDSYSRLGYTELLTIGRKALQYEVRCVVDEDYDYVDIVIMSSRGEPRVVGKFKTMAEAAEFVDAYYGEDNRYCFPVYAVNSRTSEYIREQGKASRTIII